MRKGVVELLFTRMNRETYWVWLYSKRNFFCTVFVEMCSFLRPNSVFGELGRKVAAMSLVKSKYTERN